MSGGNTKDVDILRRELRRLEVGKPVRVDYKPNRGNDTERNRAGEILNVQALGGDNYRVFFYDEEAERKIELTLRGTVGESKLRSMKTNNFTTIGSPVRVTMPEADSPNSEKFKTPGDRLDQILLVAQRNDDYEPVIAVALAKPYQDIVYWFQRNLHSE
jgi:hypothetical protein